MSRAATTISPIITRLARRTHAPVFALALSLVAAGAALGLVASAVAQGNATPVGSTAAATTDLCPDELFGPDSEAWVRSELFFGTTRDDGSTYSDEEFEAFLDAEITPRFPDGLTLLSGLGQFRNSSGEIIQEGSKLLIILYPAEFGLESSVLLEEVRDEYEDQFNQESVLRADAAAVCTSF